jgi:hypothetical protein
MRRPTLLAIAIPLLFALNGSVRAEPHLPLATTFNGSKKFDEAVAKAKREGWAKLPIGERVVKFAREFHGTPYKSYTLEIDDHIESPSANLLGLDCWTFFEISLGMARMIARDQETYRPEDLLREIEFTRYRAGVCAEGGYLERIHYLAEWFFENEARGVADDITRTLSGAERIHNRDVTEMTNLWKSYRYLRNNPSLRPAMASSEAKVEGLPVYYIPKSKVARIESKLKDGDILGIVTRYDGGFCSHVGLAVRTSDGVMRIMHASSNYKRVVIDKSVSGYLNSFKSHAGVIVARPLEVSHTVTDPSVYRANLTKLTK